MENVDLRVVLTVGLNLRTAAARLRRAAGAASPAAPDLRQPDPWVDPRIEHVDEEAVTRSSSDLGRSAERIDRNGHEQPDDGAAEHERRSDRRRGQHLT